MKLQFRLKERIKSVTLINFLNINRKRISSNVYFNGKLSLSKKRSSIFRHAVSLILNKPRSCQMPRQWKMSQLFPRHCHQTLESSRVVVQFFLGEFSARVSRFLWTCRYCYLLRVAREFLKPGIFIGCQHARAILGPQITRPAGPAPEWSIVAGKARETESQTAHKRTYQKKLTCQ